MPYSNYTKEFLHDMATSENVSNMTRLPAVEELVKRMREDKRLGGCPYRRTLASSSKSELDSLIKNPFYSSWISYFLTWLHDAVPATVRSSPAAKPSGMACVQCKEFNDYGEPNQPDGQTHVCYTCRESYKWKYGERHDCSRKTG